MLLTKEEGQRALLVLDSHLGSVPRARRRRARLFYACVIDLHLNRDVHLFYRRLVCLLPRDVTLMAVKLAVQRTREALSRVLRWIRDEMRTRENILRLSRWVEASDDGTG